MTFCLLDKTTFFDHPLLCLMKVVDWYFLETCLFDLFGFCCQIFHCCFWLLRASLNTFLFVEFSSIAWCWFTKVFNCLFCNHKFQCCWDHFLKRLFCLFLWRKSFENVSFDFLNLLFIWFPFIEWKCFMFVLELVFSV